MTPLNTPTVNNKLLNRYGKQIQQISWQKYYRYCRLCLIGNDPFQVPESVNKRLKREHNVDVLPMLYVIEGSRNMDTGDLNAEVPNSLVYTYHFFLADTSIADIQLKVDWEATFKFHDFASKKMLFPLDGQIEWIDAKKDDPEESDLNEVASFVRDDIKNHGFIR